MSGTDTPDRRVRRTKQRLVDALTSLIIEKPYAQITVQDLIDRADVGRSTFYAHYETKDDLLMTSGAEHVASDLEAGIADDPSGVEAILASLGMFKHVANRHEQIRALLGSKGIDLVQDAILAVLTTAARSAIDKRAAAGEQSLIPPDARAAYVAGSLMALLTWWLDNDMPYSPEAMADMFATLTASA